MLSNALLSVTFTVISLPGLIVPSAGLNVTFGVSVSFVVVVVPVLGVLVVAPFISKSNTSHTLFPLTSVTKTANVYFPAWFNVPTFTFCDFTPSKSTVVYPLWVSHIYSILSIPKLSVAVIIMPVPGATTPSSGLTLILGNVCPPIELLKSIPSK